VFIIPSSFLQKSTSKGKESIIKSGGRLIEAYRLPEGVFEDTSIGTDIVVFQKNVNLNQDNIFWLHSDNYLNENKQNIL